MSDATRPDTAARENPLLGVSPAPSLFGTICSFNRFYDVLLRSRYNRDVAALVDALAALRSLVQAVAGHTRSKLLSELRRAGFPLANPDRQTEELIQGIDFIPSHAAGLLWTLDAFRALIKVDLLPAPTDAEGGAE
jgi:hypothetical protein